MAKIRLDNEKLDDLIDKYNENYQVIFHEIRNAKFNWRDNNSESFFSYVDILKRKFEEFVSNLNNFRNQNKLIESNISKVDGSIDIVIFNQEQKSTILKDFSMLISNLENIKKKIDNLSIWFCSASEKSVIKKQSGFVSRNIEKLKKSNEKIVGLFNELEKIESEIMPKISELQVVKITEFDNRAYL